LDGLTDFEQGLLEKLLAGDQPVLMLLRAQAATARLVSKRQSSAGILIDLEVPRSVQPVQEPRNFLIADVIVELPTLSYGAGTLLSVTDGYLTHFEVYTYADERWPEEVVGATFRYEANERQVPFPGSSSMSRRFGH
jgi:hypothetical protein